jgi:hypothetical protein
VSNAKFGYVLLNCSTSIFCEEHVRFLLIAAYCGGSCTAAAKQMGDHPAAIFEVFERTSHIAGSYAAISVSMSKSIKVVYSRTLLH